ncbi:MAG: hypothetical protein JXR95_10905 [Deltaproteobacteria bacterium]|nr:hypothetical protein [Deltaproteobacteria bacterium]
MRTYLIFSIFFSLTFFGCARPTKCTLVSYSKIEKDIISASPDSYLNIILSPAYLTVNGARVGEIRNGKLKDQTDNESYNPLMEAVYDYFRRRGDEPYTRIILYLHKNHKPELVNLIFRTVSRTYLAPVVMMPYNFSVTDCKYKPPQMEMNPKTVYKLPGRLLIRQEKSRILVDGHVITELTDGKIPVGDFGKEGLLINPLLEVLKKNIFKKNIVPVLYITFDADMKVTRHILITAGKAGIYKLRTYRVLP